MGGGLGRLRALHAPTLALPLWGRDGGCRTNKERKKNNDGNAERFQPSTGGEVPVKTWIIMDDGSITLGGTSR